MIFSSVRWRGRSRRLTLLAALLAAVAVLAGCGSAGQAAPAADRAEAANPAVDPGSPAGGRPAPGFTLTNQDGQRVSLSQFRGRAVLLAFVDARCTTVCPLTTASMLQAVHLLGAARQHVQLIGIDANPDATRVADVRDYTTAHGMAGDWDFLTGSLSQLKQVWKDYDVYVRASQGDIDHEPAIYLIRPDGREQTIFLSQMLYTGTPQQAQVLANATAAVLPGHPRATQAVSLRYRPGTRSATEVSLPVSGGGRGVALGRGHPHLLVFFATWVNENSNLARQLQALNGYQKPAAARGWPPLAAVDEASTETSAAALPHFLSGLRPGLDYPVAVDTYGQVADGYGVTDQPWIELVSASGKILMKHDGWLSPPALAAAVRKALG